MGSGDRLRRSGTQPEEGWHTNERTRLMSAINARVKEIIANELGVEIEKVTDEASFVDDLGADSLDTVELVMAFEEEFEIEIPDEDAERMQTVGDAIKYLEGKQD